MNDVLESLDALLSTGLSDADMIELESLLLERLDKSGCQQAHQRVGYAKRLMRYHLEHNGGSTLQQQWEILLSLQQNYNAHARRLAYMTEKKKEEMQRHCTHNWQYDECSRDHRSRYVCVQCGAYR